MAKNKKHKRNNQLFVLVVLPLAAMILASFAIWMGLQNYITTSHYFKIKELKVEGIVDPRYIDVMREEILGTNIFELDTKKLAERIQRRFPTFFSIRVTRVLPSQLWIVARERMPLAVVRKDAYYLFDAQGVAIASFPLDAILNYPLLVGLENRLPKIRVGVTYETKVVKVPLRLALLLKIKMPSLKITKIDASDMDNMIFYLGNDLSVKIGKDDFENRLGLLSVILKSLGTDISNVLYVDLRPREPVVANRKK